MKLQSIQLKNFRGDSGFYEAEGIDIFTGPNGIGKTRIQQAIELGIRGAVSHPDEARNIEIDELFTKAFGTGEMGVVLTFDGLTIERVFIISEKQGKASVSQKIFINGLPKSIQEGERDIADALGSLPLMFDVHKFIRLSDNQRAEMMLRFSDGTPGYTSAGILKELFPFDSDVLAEHRKMLSSHLNGDLKKGIESAIVYLKSQESALKKESKNNQAAAVGNATANITDGTRPLREISEINAEIESCHNDHTSLSVSISEVKEQKKQFQDNETKKEALRKWIADLSKEASGEIIESKNGSISQAKDSLNEKVREIEEAADEKRKQYKEVDDLMKDARTSESIARVNLEAVTKQLENFASGKCPTCGQNAEAVVGDLNKRLTEAKKQHERLHDDAEILKARLDEVQIDLQALDAEAHAARLHNKKVEDEVHDLELELATLTQKHERLQAIKKELTELEAKSFDISLNTGEADLQLQALAIRLQVLQKEKDEKLAFDTRTVAAKEAASKAKAAKESQEWVKQSLEILTDIRWKIIRSSIEPIRSEAAQLFGSYAGKVEFDFQFTDSRGNDVFKFGWKTRGIFGDMFIDFDSLSKAQQIFTLVSLLVPMISRANPRFRFLMLDNAEVIDEESRPVFLQMLSRVTQMDNLILASSAYWPDGEGVSVHRLGVPQEAV